MGMETRATSTAHKWTHRIAALVTALVVSVLGLSVPTAAQAAGPSGPYTVSGTISFPADMPASLRNPLNQSLPYDDQTGVYFSLDVAQSGTVVGWELGKDANVSYTPSTGKWSVTGVANGTYRLTMWVKLPGNASAADTGKTVTVSGANKTAPTLTVTSAPRLRVAIGSCSTSTNWPVGYAKNLTTGVTYTLASGQSGWSQGDPRCAKTEVVYGNTIIPANATAGTYIVWAVQNGVREYLTADGGRGSTSLADAKQLSIKLWEGTDATLLFGTKSPSVTVAAAAGKEAVANAGTWNSGSILSYQWKLDGANIAGATASTYTPPVSAVGKQLSVAVTGKLAVDPLNTVTETMTSAGKTVAPASLATQTPTITGTAQAGHTLTAVPGAWTSGTAFTYQWKRDGANISEETGPTYGLGVADGGAAITVSVTGTKTGYAAATKTSAATNVALNTLTAATPTISGTAKVGKTLTAAAGTWTSGTSLAYQWKRNGANISGATGMSYKLTASDLGATITVKVSGSKKTFQSTSRESAATTAVEPGTLTAATPTISGSREVGSTLKLTRGTWTSGTTFTYRWYRDGKPISGATGTSYKLTKINAGHRISVKVHGVKAGYTTVDRYSAETGKIRK